MYIVQLYILLQISYIIYQSLQISRSIYRPTVISIAILVDLLQLFRHFIFYNIYYIFTDRRSRGFCFIYSKI